MAWFTYHQRLPSQGAHCKHPVWYVIAAFGVFLLDVLELSDVVDFKFATVTGFVAAKFTLVGIEPINNLVPLGQSCLYDPLGSIPFQGFILLLDRLVEVGQGFRAFFRLVRCPKYFSRAGLLFEFASKFREVLSWKADKKSLLK